MAVLFTTILYLAGGVLGTFHHLYFSGTTPAIIAVGGTFSALEIVPLVMIGYEAYDNWKLVRLTSWTNHYQWPVYFLVAVAFWNLVGAGLFGFLIHPPVALYYMQGLNTTSVLAHAALVGLSTGAKPQVRRVSTPASSPKPNRAIWWRGGWTSVPA